MNKLFTDDILDVDIPVRGETNVYKVKISIGGFLDSLHERIRKDEKNLNLSNITRALVSAFNKDNVYIYCTCPDWKYRMGYYATKNQINSGPPEDRPSKITNPRDTKGPGCKHALAVLSNTSWIVKVASVINNYINYMKDNQEQLYADVIYPAVFEKRYEEPVQLTLDTTDTLNTTEKDIDRSNQYARTKTQFKPGNQSGVQFAPEDNTDQLSLDNI